MKNYKIYRTFKETKILLKILCLNLSIFYSAQHYGHYAIHYFFYYQILGVMEIRY